MAQGAWEVSINPEWCKKCGLCIAFCPKKVLGAKETGEVSVVDEDACIGCLLCEMHCPDFAISIKRREGK